MRRIKVVIVGDGAVGKTCLFVTFTTKQFPEEYVPTIFDCDEYNYLYKGEQFGIGIWDTMAAEDYDRLRPLCYPQTDVFLLCYSINNQRSFNNIKLRWIPEINGIIRNIPVIVVATKSDLRNNSQQENDDLKFIEEEEGLEMAKSVGAFDFIEVSSNSYSNVDKLFDHVIEIYKNKQPFIDLERKQKGCFVC